MGDDLTEQPDYLTATVSDRGLRYMPPIANKFGTTVGVSDSSADESPSLWLRITQTTGDDMQIALTYDDALRLVAQIDALTTTDPRSAS